MAPPREMPLSQLRLDGGTQTRAAIDEATVNLYAGCDREGAEFPPVIAFFDGVNYWLADGFHRYYARLKNLRETVEVDVRGGALRDAILYAVGANAEHGRQRTGDDKYRCVLILLGDPEWAGKPNVTLAGYARVSEYLVAKIRAQVADGRLTPISISCARDAPDPNPPYRTTRDGRKFPARLREARERDPLDLPPEPAPEPAPQPVPCDANGVPIPEPLLPVFAEGWKFDRALQLAAELRGLVGSIHAGPVGGEYLDVDDDLEELAYAIDGARPWTVGGGAWRRKLHEG